MFPGCCSSLLLISLTEGMDVRCRSVRFSTIISGHERLSADGETDMLSPYSIVALQTS